MDLYAACSDRPRFDVGAPAVRPARQPAQSPRPGSVPLERDVQRAVLAYLRAHPAILKYGQLNSGTASMDDGRPIWFHGLGNGAPDIVGMMRRHCSFLAIEVKRPGAKPRPEQIDWLRTVADAGGCAGWVTCVEDAQRIVGEWLRA
jgi:hypothetical protein